MPCTRPQRRCGLGRSSSAKALPPPGAGVMTISVLTFVALRLYDYGTLIRCRAVAAARYVRSRFFSGFIYGTEYAPHSAVFELSPSHVPTSHRTEQSKYVPQTRTSHSHTAFCAVWGGGARKTDGSSTTVPRRWASLQYHYIPPRIPPYFSLASHSTVYRVPRRDTASTLQTRKGPRTKMRDFP